MHDMKKTILATVSGVVLAVGVAQAAPPAPADAGNPAAQKNIKVVDKAKTDSAIKIKEDAKPGKKLMDNNLGKTPSQEMKTKADAKPGKNMDLTRR